MEEITDAVLEDLALKILNLLQIARRMRLIKMSGNIDGCCDVLVVDIFPIDAQYPHADDVKAERIRHLFVPVRTTDSAGSERPDFAIKDDHSAMLDTVAYLEDLIKRAEPLTLAGMMSNTKDTAA